MALSLSARIGWMTGILILVNALIWVGVFMIGDAHFIGLATVAWTFGLRHGLDADHICAIDNVTRRLMENGIESISVGLYFSLGHSVVVFLASLGVIMAVTFSDHITELGAILAMGISSTFLLLIGLLNLYVAIKLVKQLRQVKRERQVEEKDQAGAIGQFLMKFLLIIDRPWKMFPVGMLFGLGFETATEIVVLSMSAASASNGTPIEQTIFFPLLFTAGMTLVDTVDGMLMLKIYHWAFVNPVKKLFFNLTITLMSVAMALLVGGIQFLVLLKTIFELEGPFWDYAEEANEAFGIVGVVIVALFIGTWLFSYVAYRVAGYKDIEDELHQTAV